MQHAIFGHPDGPSDGARIRPALALFPCIAEAGGLSVFTLMDHCRRMVRVGRIGDPMLEGYATLRLLAG